jgi:hypothetical protein
MQKLREKLESPSYNHALAYQNIREALEIVMRWIDDYCETGPENDFERVEKIANAAMEYTPPAAPVPLTDEQRSKMYRTAVLRGDSIMVRSDYELGISDAEAAHGITEKGQP